VTPPRPPSGPAGGARLLWVVAAAVLFGALVLAGRLLDAGPGPTAATRATRAAAPTTTLPAGAVAVEGVTMVPTSRAFRASCRRAADRLGFAVPCPEVLPVPASGAAPVRLCDAAEPGACQDELLWFPMEAFVVPPDFAGAPGSLGALAILATPERRLAGGALSWCPAQRPVAAPALSGRPAVLATCPAGFQGWSAESVLLRWSDRGTFVAVALRGPSEGNQRLVVALAGRLRLVPPR
jgi:hypothetical protein